LTSERSRVEGVLRRLTQRRGTLSEVAIGKAMAPLLYDAHQRDIQRAEVIAIFGRFDFWDVWNNGHNGAEAMNALAKALGVEWGRTGFEDIEDEEGGP
jgi:hypothetical protein